MRGAHADLHDPSRSHLLSTGVLHRSAVHMLLPPLFLPLSPIQPPLADLDHGDTLAGHGREAPAPLGENPDIELPFP